MKRTARLFWIYSVWILCKRESHLVAHKVIPWYTRSYLWYTKSYLGTHQVIPMCVWSKNRFERTNTCARSRVCTPWSPCDHAQSRMITHAHTHAQKHWLTGSKSRLTHTHTRALTSNLRSEILLYNSYLGANEDSAGTRKEDVLSTHTHTCTHPRSRITLFHTFTQNHTEMRSEFIRMYTIASLKKVDEF